MLYLKTEWYLPNILILFFFYAPSIFSYISIVLLGITLDIMYCNLLYSSLLDSCIIPLILSVLLHHQVKRKKSIIIFCTYCAAVLCLQYSITLGFHYHAELCKNLLYEYIITCSCFAIINSYSRLHIARNNEAT
ncbi:hypothetical protein [Candidatus Sarmatiella mevalonica]|uniref:hypothetical protein n=1 Tax=Candidatus Sarmatiella mevalonica TaxID=2770581 RepID=UPI001920FD33|nr:hypothetical protein [Candidatus Sarmatiella mevalonica]